MTIKPLYQQALEEPEKFLGRLYFTPHGSLYDGSLTGVNRFLCSAPSVQELLASASRASWHLARLPSPGSVTWPRGGTMAAWLQSQGILVFRGVDFFAGHYSRPPAT